MPSASWSSNRGSFWSFIDSRFANGFRFGFARAVFERQRAHGIQVLLLHARRPEQHADEEDEENADREDPINTDPADVFENVFDHRLKEFLTTDDTDEPNAACAATTGF